MTSNSNRLGLALGTLSVRMETKLINGGNQHDAIFNY